AEKEAHIRLVFDNMPGAIVYTDEELNIVVCTDRFADIYQAPRELLQPSAPALSVILKKCTLFKDESI
ncbi:MAG: hypothetical protein ACE10J_08360, partial [Thermodesulfobacteriota bacterium]